MGTVVAVRKPVRMRAHRDGFDLLEALDQRVFV